MSDTGFFNEEEDYDFVYTEESNSEPDADMENQYYNAKNLKETAPLQALDSFNKVLDIEGDQKGEWGFKALKQIMKLLFRLNRYEDMMYCYKNLLTYIKTSVTRNHSEKSINSILDYISKSKDMTLLQSFYETTLEALKETKNDRLWFKTNTKLGKLYYDMGEYTKLAKIIRQLRLSCQTDDGEDDVKKGTQQLEILALEIQMHTVQRNNKKLKKLYEQSLRIKSALPHPWIMAVIRECGGKMHLSEGQYEKAHTDFFEAFKNYDESGSSRRTTCLKYLVFANMLMSSDINPFDSQEAKPYKNDPDILAVTNLVSAYQTGDLIEFERILKENKDILHADPFIREHLEQLTKNCRAQVLLKIIQPYKRLKIPFISTQLNIDEEEVENLLVSLILDNTIRGRIDQVNKVLVLDDKCLRLSHYSAIDKWTEQISFIQQNVLGKLQ